LRVPWARVAGEGVEAQAGRRPAGSALVEAPLVSGSREIGWVQVAVPASRRWRPADDELLAALARHGGMVVRAVALAEALTRSRRELVAAGEEERRRVGRNLHDGLGPTLAALTMQLGSLRQLVAPGSREEAGLRRLEGVSREALAELRRVARELRPTALDQFGLTEALVRHAAEMGVLLDVRDEVTVPLPAAVEVAAYRIGQQAVGNVAAHAGVGEATMTLAVDGGDLDLRVVDRGRGLGEAVREGVGLSSMRERAAELGGTCEVSSDRVGTVVRARLPVAAAPVRAR
jgi:signal transduction histidine kinase